MAADLVLHGNTPLPMAMRATASMARGYFDSDPFAEHKKGLEGRRKQTEGLFALIAGVQKSILHLARVMGSRR